MLARFVTIALHIVFRMLAFSTLTQFGAAGTNQLYFAALANGASAGFFALTPSSVVELAMLPAFAISVSEAVPVNALTQSAASDLFLLCTGIPMSEPPRNVGMYRPTMWLGIGYAPIFFAKDAGAAPPFGLNTYGHSQPLPMNAAARPFANGTLGYGCASSFVLLAREKLSVMLLKAVRALIAWGELSTPCHLLPLWTAIWPP